MNNESGKDSEQATEEGDAFDAVLDTWAPPVRTIDIRRRGEMALSGVAPESLRQDLVERLGLEALRNFAWRGKLTFESGEISFDGVIEADLDQACVVTLEPVRQKVSEPVSRCWLPQKRYDERLAALALRVDQEEIAAGEAERGATGLDLSVDGADEIEPLGETVRLGPSLIEALSLALEPYPRAANNDFVSVVAAPDGVAPLDDEAVRPFAGLAALREQLEQSSPDKEDPEDSGSSS